MNGLYFALCGGKEYRQPRHQPSQIQVIEKPGEKPYLMYKEDISKNHQGGLNSRKCPKLSFIMLIWKIQRDVLFGSLNSTTVFVHLTAHQTLFTYNHYKSQLCSSGISLDHFVMLHLRKLLEGCVKRLG